MNIKEFWKRPIGRPRRRWENNIKTDLGEISCENDGWNWLRIMSNGGFSY
jgi:hypothetical protein